MPNSNPDTVKIKTYLVAALCGLIIVAALGGAGLALILRFEQTNEARTNNAHVWHEVVCSIERFTLQRDDLPADKKLSALRFYDGLLVDNVKTAPCGLADQLRR